MSDTRDGRIPPPAARLLLLEVSASPETFPPVPREGSRKTGTERALAHFARAREVIRAAGGREVAASSAYPVAVVEAVVGDLRAPLREVFAGSGLTLRTLWSAMPEGAVSFEDRVAEALGVSEAWIRGDLNRADLLARVSGRARVWGLLPWLAKWLENWPRRSPTEAELVVAADHFVRGIDARESAAALSEGRRLEEEGRPAPAEHDVPDGEGGVPGGGAGDRVQAVEEGGDGRGGPGGPGDPA